MPPDVLAWNLFHGRDFPPDPALRTWRSRLCRREERGETHVQVNRELLDEFAAVLAGASWDVALLQECPPRWAGALAWACGAEAHRVLTSRNSLGWARAAAARLNPDLLASSEGGSNLTLVRAAGPAPAPDRAAAPNPAARCEKCTERVQNSHREAGVAVAGGAIAAIAERREVAVHDGPSERRAMALTLVRGSALAAAGAAPAGGATIPAGATAALEGTPSSAEAIAPDDVPTPHSPDLCVANLHASADDPALAAADVLRAAEAASAWAAGRPLVFGGDLNLRPAESPAVFEELRRRFGLDGPTGPRAIDHILVAGMATTSPPRAWAPEEREVAYRGLALRLSDHAPVQGEFSSYGSNTVVA